VADPQLFIKDPDPVPDPTWQIITDPDPTWQFISDLDPTLQVVSDPDPDSCP